MGTDVGIKPQIRDGVIYSDGTTILGGDDKSGVAVILEVLQTLQEDGMAHPPLEVVLSVSEEIGLARRAPAGQEPTARPARLRDGRRRADRHHRHLRAQPGLVASHRPRQEGARRQPSRRQGINAIRVASEAIAAMPLGRIDAETTANIGVIEGGTATNIVPDEVKVRGEARSRDDFKLATQTAAMAHAFQDAAERNGARVELKIKRAYTTYALSAETPVVATAMRAAERLGFTPVLKASGGGTDANIYAEHGIQCAVLSTGQAEVHTTHEHIAIADMINSARWLLESVTA